MACPFVENPVDEVQLQGHSRTGQIHWAFRMATYLSATDSEDTVLYIFVNYWGHILKKTTRRSKALYFTLTKPQTVCIALRFFASGAFLYSVGDAERLSKATVCREIRKVCLALKRFLNIFITFPGHRGILPIKEAFFRTAGFPNVIGAIDCTHIRIKAPSGPTEADYVNRKSFHSINVQMICTAKYLFSNIEAKWPGSVHDSRIFCASSLAQRFAQGAFPGLLLGDRGYPCQPFLLTPYADPTTNAERRFNRTHSKTRACIEIAFGQLKSRFNCLRHLRVTPERACDIVAACAVLHNVAILQKEAMPRVQLEHWEDNILIADHMDGRAVRDMYANTYFG